MKIKTFFQPRWYVPVILILFLFIETFLLKDIFGEIGPGTCMDNGCDLTASFLSYNWFVFAGMFLIPIVLIYLLIYLIFFIIKKSKK